MDKKNLGLEKNLAIKMNKNRLSKKQSGLNRSKYYSRLNKNENKYKEETYEEEEGELM